MYFCFFYVAKPYFIFNQDLILSPLRSPRAIEIPISAAKAKHKKEQLHSTRAIEIPIFAAKAKHRKEQLRSPRVIEIPIFAAKAKHKKEQLRSPRAVGSPSFGGVGGGFYTFILTFTVNPSLSCRRRRV